MRDCWGSTAACGSKVNATLFLSIFLSGKVACGSAAASAVTTSAASRFESEFFALLLPPLVLGLPLLGLVFFTLAALPAATSISCSVCRSA